jgi:hypothetical protein
MKITQIKGGISYEKRKLLNNFHIKFSVAKSDIRISRDFFIH